MICQYIAINRVKMFCFGVFRSMLWENLLGCDLEGSFIEEYWSVPRRIAGIGASKDKNA